MKTIRVNDELAATRKSLSPIPDVVMGSTANAALRGVVDKRNAKKKKTKDSMDQAYNVGYKQAVMDLAYAQSIMGVDPLGELMGMGGSMSGMSGVPSVAEAPMPMAPLAPPMPADPMALMGPQPEGMPVDPAAMQAMIGG